MNNYFSDAGCGIFGYGYFARRRKRKVLHGVTSPLNHFPYLNFFVSPYRSLYLTVLASGNWRHKKLSNLKNQNSVTLDFHLLRTTLLFPLRANLVNAVKIPAF